MREYTLWSFVQVARIYCEVDDGLFTHQSIYWKPRMSQKISEVQVTIFV